jgi:hypothetical protein
VVALTVGRAVRALSRQRILELTDDTEMSVSRKEEAPSSSLNARLHSERMLLFTRSAN